MFGRRVLNLLTFRDTIALLQWFIVYIFSRISSLAFTNNFKYVKTANLQLKALDFLYAFEESVDCSLLSTFAIIQTCTYQYYVLSTMGVSMESTRQFLIGNPFHVKLRTLSLYSNRNFQCDTFNQFLLVA